MTARRVEDLAPTLSWFDVALDDKQLTLAFQRGEMDAYQAIYERYSARVHGVCRRMLNQSDDAQEAAQETFLRVYQALGRFNGRYQLGSWITRIATNVCLDHLRARSRRPADATPPELMDMDPWEPRIADDPETLCIRNAEGRRVRRVLASLQPLHRAAIVLRDFEGLSYEDIGVALGITDCQVKALLHRARAKFKRSWGPAGLASFLPARLLHRLRELESARDQAAQVASSTTQVVSQCSVLLQQCGQIVTERIATGAVAVLVGVAAAAPIVTHATTRQETRPVVAVTVGATDARSTGPAVKASPAKKSHRTVIDDVSPAPAPQPAPEPAAEPAPEPEPTPTPGEGPPPSDDDPNSAPDDSAPPIDPEPIPFTPALGFDTGSPITEAAPFSHEATVDCAAGTFTQRLGAAISYGDEAYSALLVLNGTNTLSGELTVWKNGREIRYTLGGATVASVHGDDDTYTLSYQGGYGTGSPDAPLVNLPSEGRFRANITLDCATQTVITESVVFAVN